MINKVTLDLQTFWDLFNFWRNPISNLTAS